MPNFSSLARLEVPEKFLWVVVGGGWGLQSHFRVKPNHLLRLGWGFDNSKSEYSHSKIPRLVLKDLDEEHIKAE